MLKVLLLSLILSSCLDKARNFVQNKMGKTQNEMEIPMPPILKIMQEEQKPVEEIQIDEFAKIEEKQKLKYQSAFLQEVVLATTRVKISDAEYENWMNVLVQGGSREGIYHGLVLGDYYRRLEEESNPALPIIATFTQEYMNEFLMQKFDEELLKDVNIFKLKNVVSEKTMDLIDKLSYKREYLANWYTLFSVYLARKFPNLWKNELRKSMDKTTHLLWASRMPLGHIKSEAVIKLHTVFNTLGQI